jgi:hypothetical protein
MIASFEERLNHVLPRLLSSDVLDNKGAGGEIGFWIFDYPPENEMQMRSWLTEVIEPGLRKQLLARNGPFHRLTIRPTADARQCPQRVERTHSISVAAGFNPTYERGHWFLGVLLVAKGDRDAALIEIERVNVLDGRQLGLAPV